MKHDEAAEVGRVRDEQRRRKKIKVREKVEKSRRFFFHCFVAPQSRIFETSATALCSTPGFRFWYMKRQEEELRKIPRNNLSQPLSKIMFARVGLLGHF